MAKYILNLFSPETWSAFRANGSAVSGFSQNQQRQAERNIGPGDTFLCYMAGLSRWCGALKVESRAFFDDTPIFKPTSDPYVVRFRVSPIHELDVEHAIPINDAEIWNTLSWTKNITPGSVGWGANFQRSLREMPSDDGRFVLSLLERQAAEKHVFPLSSKDQRRLRPAATVRTAAGELEVNIPDEVEAEETAAILTVTAAEDAQQDQLRELTPREPHIIQGLIFKVGSAMGFKLWCPKADRERVIAASDGPFVKDLLDTLPFNYNEATVRTIEQIDALWIRGRSIVRAFEVEHTTAIYSGILRMADLVALQPNMNVPMHIVAPSDRRELVLEQIRRPVFALLETGPLAERCTLISYDSIRELAAMRHLKHLSPSILDDYQEFS